MRDPCTVMTCQAVISPCSDDFTNEQMKQQLLVVKKYRWVPGGLSCPPVPGSCAGTAPWGQGASPRALRRQPNRRSPGLCRCALRLLPAGWTREGDLRDNLHLLPARSWRPRPGLCCHLVVRLGIAGGCLWAGHFWGCIQPTLRSQGEPEANPKQGEYLCPRSHSMALAAWLPQSLLTYRLGVTL